MILNTTLFRTALKICICAMIIVINTLSLYGKIWQVGESKAYTTPSQVSTLVRDGDTVDIDAGIYPEDVALWQANNLFLRGIGGYAYLKSNGADYGGKAIWVIKGNNVTVEWIEFAECTVPDQNGAGIRYEGLNLTVRHCFFHHNQMGILGGEYHPSTVKIEYCEFAYQGNGDGYTHNVYIGNIDTLIFRGNYSHHAIIGHELKSRAFVNIIEYNRLSNEADGTASREIDLPNGGTAIILGNIIQQGPHSENSNLVGYGLEGLKNQAPHEVYLINNTLINQKNNGSYVQVKEGTVLLKCYNNIFAGGGYFLSGTPDQLDTAGNIFSSSIAALAFSDIDNYDYHLTEESLAINIGKPAGSTAEGYSLTPEYEYVHPTATVPRTNHGIIDAGAYEYAGSSRTWQEKNKDVISVINCGYELLIESEEKIKELDIYDMSGRLLIYTQVNDESKHQDIHCLSPGMYFIKITTKSDHHHIRKFLVND